MGISEATDGLFKVIYADFIGPMPRSKNGNLNQYCLVIQDQLSKWVELFPLRQATAKQVARILEDHIFCRFGSPKLLITDNGAQFISKVVKKLCRDWIVKHLFTSVYHPQANQSERANQNLKTMIRAFIDSQQSSWDVNFQKFALALTTVVNESTKVTPSLLNLGRQIQLPFDRNLSNDISIENINVQELASTLPTELQHIISWVRDNIAEAQITYKEYYDKFHKEVRFKIGQKVLVRTHPMSDADKGISAKLEPKWEGPYVIESKITDVSYSVKRLEDNVVSKRHVSDIKPYFEREHVNKTRLNFLKPCNAKSKIPAVNNRTKRTLHIPGMYKV